MRTTWDDPRSLALRTLLDEEMTKRYTGRHDDDPDFPAKAAVAFAVDPTRVVAVLLAVDPVPDTTLGAHAAGCGPVDDEGRDPAAGAVGHAVVRWLDDRLEVKKVVVTPDARGRGVGRALMAAVEQVARELGIRSLLLQTGDRQPDAIAMYENLGYRRVPVFNPYLPITNSVCFEKHLD